MNGGPAFMFRATLLTILLFLSTAGLLLALSTSAIAIEGNLTIERIGEGVRVMGIRSPRLGLEEEE